MEIVGQVAHWCDVLWVNPDNGRQIMAWVPYKFEGSVICWLHSESRFALRSVNESGSCRKSNEYGSIQVYTVIQSKHLALLYTSGVNLVLVVAAATMITYWV